MEEHTWVLTFAPRYLKHKCTRKLVAVSWKEYEKSRRQHLSL